MSLGHWGWVAPLVDIVSVCTLTDNEAEDVRFLLGNVHMVECC